MIYPAMGWKQQWDLYKSLGFWELKLSELGITGVLFFVVYYFFFLTTEKRFLEVAEADMTDHSRCLKSVM